MGDPFTTSLIVGGLTAGTSVLQATQQNEAIERAAEAEKAQQDAAAAERKQQVARELQAVEGSIRASSAGRGVSGSRSVEALSLSTFETALLQQENIELNRFFGNAATDARAGANTQNPLLAGISGFTSGVQLASSFQGLGGGGTPSGPNFTSHPQNLRRP